MKNFTTLNSFIWVLLLLIISTFVFISCKKTSVDSLEPELITNALILRDKREVLTSQIEPSGGQIVVTDEESPLSGLKIDAPQGAFSKSHSIKISSYQIESHRFGPNFNSIGPVIRIEDDGETAQKYIKVTVPIKLPNNHFGAAFVYNTEKNKFELLPITAQSQTELTFYTNSFNTKNASKNARIATDIGILIVLTSIEQATLDQQSISTNFKPEQDGWEFSNYGTFYGGVTPGFSLGMIVGANYYFNELKASNGKSLYANSSLGKNFVPISGGRDKDALWMDNVPGIYVAQSIESIASPSIRSSLGRSITNNKEVYDRITINLITYYWLLNGEAFPVYLEMGDYAFTNGLSLLVIGKAKDKLIVYDPNYPATSRTIDYNHTEGFLKYSSTLDGYKLENFKEVGIYPFNSIVDRNSVQNIWNNAKSSALPVITGAGVTGNGKKFLIETSYDTPTSIESERNLYTADSSISIIDEECFVQGNPCNYGSFGVPSRNESGETDILVLDKNGKEIISSRTSTTLGYKSYIKLRNLIPGKQEIAIYKRRRDFNGIYRWINFSYATFTLNFLSIKGFSAGDPKSEIGKENVEYSFSINTDSNNLILNPTVKFEWDFGDGTPKDIVIGNNKINHTYKKGGSYNSTVTIVQGNIRTTLKKSITITGTLPESYITFTIPASSDGNLPARNYSFTQNYFDLSTYKRLGTGTLFIYNSQTVCNRHIEFWAPTPGGSIQFAINILAGNFKEIGVSQVGKSAGSIIKACEEPVIPYNYSPESFWGYNERDGNLGLIYVGSFGTVEITEYVPLAKAFPNDSKPNVSKMVKGTFTLTLNQNQGEAGSKGYKLAEELTVQGSTLPQKITGSFYLPVVEF